MLAMLRCTKIWPGARPVMVVSGTRLSEQPSQRMGGCWPVASVLKKAGCVLAVWVAQARFCVRACARASVRRGGQRVEMGEGEEEGGKEGRGGEGNEGEGRRGEGRGVGVLVRCSCVR